MTFKEKIYFNYLHIIKDKVAMLQQTLADLKESGSNETKSTAGDKHETALAMLQIEQANNRGLLQDALEQHAGLKNINPNNVSQKVTNGSLVKTNKGYFFMSIALGKIVVDEFTIFALSPQSPLGAKFMGMSIGHKTNVNGNEYLVEVIL